MKRLYTLLLVILLSLAGATFVLSQKLHITKVDPSGFPDVKIHFYAIRSNGDTLRTPVFSEADMYVLEKGKVKLGTIECPQPDTSNFSLILVCDISGSMKDKVEGSKTKIDIAKQIMSEFIKTLPNGRFECAILAFHQDVNTICDFTDDKAILNNTLKSDSLVPVATASDLNSALLYDMRVPPGEGALVKALRAKYKPYVVLITDGGHSSSPRPDVMVDSITKKAMELGTKINIVTMTPPENLAPSQIDNLIALSNYVYWNKRSNLEITGTVNDILHSISYEIQSRSVPCIFTYKADCDGGGDIELNIDLDLLLASSKINIKYPDDLFPELEINDEIDTLIYNIPGDSKKLTTLKLTARKNYIEFSGEPYISHQAFRILAPDEWSKIKILKDQSIGMTLEYTGVPDDSSCQEAKIFFNSKFCNLDTFKIYAGWIFCRPVNFGDKEIGKEHSLQYSSVFCNNSCFDVTVENISLAGADNNYFNFDQVSLPKTLHSGENIDINFKFNPNSERDFETNLNVKVNDDIFASKITGKGILPSGDINNTVNPGNPIFMIHPNPTSNNLIVNINLPKESDIEITILGLDGRMFFREISNKVLNYYKLHNLNFLPSGVYILQLKTNGKIYDNAFIKN